MPVSTNPAAANSARLPVSTRRVLRVIAPSPRSRARRSACASIRRAIPSRRQPGSTAMRLRWSAFPCRSHNSPPTRRPLPISAIPPAPAAKCAATSAPLSRRADIGGSGATGWAAKAARTKAAMAAASSARIARSVSIAGAASVITPTVAPPPRRAYLAAMSETPAFLDPHRPDVPDIVVPRGIVPFHLPKRPVRGRLIRLGPLAEALLTRHDNPEPVTVLAGQALALVAGLAAALKFRGSFSLQAKGDGPVPLLLADCTDAGALRGYARFNAAKLAALLAETPEPGAAGLLGGGYLAFTVDQGPERHRHQGIVAIEGASLAEMALHYFATSEQLRCHLHLACARTETGWRAGALILEKIAGAGGVDPGLSVAAQEESWRTAQMLAATLTDAELLDDALSPERLLYRLFHAEGDIALDRTRALAYGCRCSRARLSGILEGFPADDLDHMTVDGDIVMTCEFCNFDFRFPRAEVRGTAAGAARH